MEKENKIPALEAMDKEEVTGFNHDNHISKVKEELEKILISNDINEIKTIAKGLLKEEKIEEASEKGADVNKDKAEMSLQDYLKGDK